jgi:hypothetical protein
MLASQLEEDQNEELFPIWIHVRRLLGLDSSSRSKKHLVVERNDSDWELHSFEEEPQDTRFVRTARSDREDAFNTSVPSIADIKRDYSKFKRSSKKASPSAEVRLLFPQITSPRYLTAMQELQATYLTPSEAQKQSIFATKDPVDFYESSSPSKPSYSLSASRIRY